MCEVVSKFTPSRVVTDAVAIQKYYRERYRKETEMIAYGADVQAPLAADPDFGLPNGRYILYVSRFEPENNPELVVRAYAQLETDWPLVMVGNSIYDPAYEKFLREIADPRVIFLGAVYANGYWALQRNAGVFVFACEVGGTHPALVEAMAAGKAVAYLHNTENAETAGGCAMPFEPRAEDLAAKLKLLIDDQKLRADYGLRAGERARTRYSWDSITDQYEALMQSLIAPATKPLRNVTS
jgi:glycosyltransferase involved in cell wall biosynthesis